MGPHARRLLRTRPRQPDQRSCGAACLVMAQALLDDDYADYLLVGRHPRTGRLLGGDPTAPFREEVLGMHRRVTSLADLSGRVQWPWPRALGTAPWALARQLSVTTGTTYVVRLVAAGPLQAALAQGQPVALYVGNRWLPRHVVLAVDSSGDRAGDRVATYDPASGHLRGLSIPALRRRRAAVAGWTHAWLMVLPRAAHPSAISTA